MQPADAHRLTAQLYASGDGNGVRLTQEVRCNGGVHGKHESLKLFVGAVGHLNVDAATAGVKKSGQIDIGVSAVADGDAHAGWSVGYIGGALPQVVGRVVWQPGWGICEGLMRRV